MPHYFVFWGLEVTTHTFEGTRENQYGHEKSKALLHTVASSSKTSVPPCTFSQASVARLTADQKGVTYHQLAIPVGKQPQYDTECTDTTSSLDSSNQGIHPVHFRPKPGSRQTAYSTTHQTNKKIVQLLILLPTPPPYPSPSLESARVEAACVLHRLAANRTGSTLQRLSARKAAGLMAARDEYGLHHQNTNSCAIWGRGLVGVFIELEGQSRQISKSAHMLLTLGVCRKQSPLFE